MADFRSRFYLFIYFKYRIIAPITVIPLINCNSYLTHECINDL